MSSTTVCIITGGTRTVELERCLRSIEAGSKQPEAVIVSDDGRNPENRILCEELSARYLEGPKRGMCANRNHAIAAAATAYVVPLDDDAQLGAEFIAAAEDAIRGALPNQIFSGYVHDSQQGLLRALRGTYLGFFAEATPETANAFNINACMFPRRAFDHLQFDERLEYGYDEMDLAIRLRAAGYEIVVDPRMVNSHDPPAVTDGQTAKRLRLSRQARFLVQLKRRWLHRWPISLLSGTVWFAIASTHETLAMLRRGRSVTDVWRDIGWALLALRKG